MLSDSSTAACPLTGDEVVGLPAPQMQPLTYVRAHLSLAGLVDGFGRNTRRERARPLKADCQPLKAQFNVDTQKTHTHTLYIFLSLCENFKNGSATLCGWSTEEKHNEGTLD